MPPTGCLEQLQPAAINRRANILLPKTVCCTCVRLADRGVWGQRYRQPGFHVDAVGPATICYYFSGLKHWRVTYSPKLSFHHSWTLICRCYRAAQRMLRYEEQSAWQDEEAMTYLVLSVKLSRLGTSANQFQFRLPLPLSNQHEGGLKNKPKLLPLHLRANETQHLNQLMQGNCPLWLLVLQRKPIPNKRINACAKKFTATKPVRPQPTTNYRPSAASFPSTLI